MVKFSGYKVNKMLALFLLINFRCINLSGELCNMTFINIDIQNIGAKKVTKLIVVLASFCSALDCVYLLRMKPLFILIYVVKVKAGD